jgi:gamma-glutamyl phosphate reductase
VYLDKEADIQKAVKIAVDSKVRAEICGNVRVLRISLFYISVKLY